MIFFFVELIIKFSIYNLIHWSFLVVVFFFLYIFFNFFNFLITTALALEHRPTPGHFSAEHEQDVSDWTKLTGSGAVSPLAPRLCIPALYLCLYLSSPPTRPPPRPSASLYFFIFLSLSPSSPLLLLRPPPSSHPPPKPNRAEVPPPLSLSCSPFTRSSILYTCQVLKLFAHLHLCSIGQLSPSAEHWRARHQFTFFCCTEIWTLCTLKKKIYIYIYIFSSSLNGKLLNWWVLLFWKWPGHLLLLYDCLFCVRVCVFDMYWGSTSSFPPGEVMGGGVARPCWPDCQSTCVPRLFSLAEYGSAGERSRRAKKRNIGRYT